jgi:YegS/Rv2252/BmrU family lipid kinase
MRYIFIVNPTSGNYNGIKVGNVIKEYCDSIQVNYELIYTKEKNDATKIALNYKDKDNTVIYSVGGDGTLNEVVNGLIDSKASLSLIPAGSGNDFYRSIKDYVGDKIDVGKVNDRYFINIASIGLDAEVADSANKLKRFHLPKKLIYLISLIKTFFIYRGIKVKIDGKEKEITIFTVCNAKYYGGGFKIAPNAKINNGVFDVVDIKSVSKFKILTILTKLINAKHTKSGYVDIYNKDSISIKSDNPILCNIDGEVMIDTKFDFHLEKSAIKYSGDSIGICKVLRRKKLIK